MGATQTSVSALMTRGFAGMCADTSFQKDVVSKVNAEASAEIAFGSAVVKGTGDDDVKIPALTSDVLVGIVAHSHAYEKDIEVGDTGIKPKMTVGVARHGRWLVTVDVAVTPSSPVRVRMDNNAGKVPGQFCTAAVAGHTTLLVGAKYRTTTAGAGVVEIELDATAFVQTAD